MKKYVFIILVSLIQIGAEAQEKCFGEHGQQIPCWHEEVTVLKEITLPPQANTYKNARLVFYPVSAEFGGNGGVIHQLKMPTNQLEWNKLVQEQITFFGTSFPHLVFGGVLKIEDTSGFGIFGPIAISDATIRVNINDLEQSTELEIEDYLQSDNFWKLLNEPLHEGVYNSNYQANFQLQRVRTFLNGKLWNEKTLCIRKVKKASGFIDELPKAVLDFYRADDALWKIFNEDSVHSIPVDKCPL